MTQWEYDIEEKTFNQANVSKFQEKVEYMNARGKEGWEFISVTDKLNSFFKNSLSDFLLTLTLTSSSSPTEYSKIPLLLTSFLL